MFANYLIIAWRNIIKKPLFSAINIFGLAIGLASCILILLYVDSETGYDSWIADSDRVVRMHTAYTGQGRPPFLTVRSAGKMVPALKDYLRQDIESAVRLVSWGTTIRNEGQGFDDNVIFAGQDFFKVLPLPLTHGDSASGFNKPNDLLVSEETAIRYFGRTDVVGETLTLCCMGDQAVELAITGVIKDLPENSHLDMSLLVYMDVAVFSNFPWVLDTWTSVNVYSYFKLKPGAKLAQTQERIDYWLNNESPFSKDMRDVVGANKDRKVTDGMQLKLMPLEDLHLKARQDAGTMGDLSPMGDRSMVVTFSLIAVLILVIACINFMNLSTARSGSRATEVAMRKVLGASRKQVATQFLVEAVGLVFIAMLLALVLVELVLPFYNQILNKEIALNLLQQPDLLGTLFVVGLLVGVGSGSYPALVLSGYRPGHILKSGKGQSAGGSARLRNALVIFQFAISIGLLVSTCVVFLQTRYASEMDLGYSSDKKLVVGISTARDRLDSLKQQLEALPDVSSVVFSSEAPSQDNENNNFYTRPGLGDEQPVTELLNHHSMDYGFFEAYGVEATAGRLFDQSYGSDTFVSASEETEGGGAVILNQSAVRKLGFSSDQQAIGQRLTSIYDDVPHNMSIVGVIPDLYFRSVKFDIRPTVYYLNREQFRVATVSYQSGNETAIRQQVEQVWKRVVPLEPIHIRHLDEMLERQYRQEQIQMRLFSVFAILAIVVACLGLYGLAAFSAERRTKEIGIRKVMGASVKNIVWLLVLQFTRPVIWANLMAWPVSAYLMLNWLEQFPYRIELFWLLPICLGAGLISMLVAWLTVGGNAARVARANPIGALRHE